MNKETTQAANDCISTVQYTFFIDLVKKYFYINDDCMEKNIIHNILFELI